jgi:hypothetical protein
MLLAMASQGLEKISELRMPGGAAEILTFDPATKLVASTRVAVEMASVVFVSLEDPYQPKVAGEVDLRKTHPNGVQSISSVAADPLGRGFVAVSILPNEPTLHKGIVVIVDTRTREIIRILDTAYHPDCVTISKDGLWLLVANEGEYAKLKTNTPGSLGVADLSGVKTAADFDKVVIKDYPLGPKQLVAGVRTPFTSDPAQRHLDLEPEYVISDERYAYISLQENNALAVFDLRRKIWKRLIPFGSWPVRMDVSDRDGVFARPEINVDTTVDAMPMPDTIAALKANGKTLILTANEGEGDEICRVKHLGIQGPMICPKYRARLKEQFGVDPQHDSALGRLQVSTVDGLNEMGQIERFVAVGTRSFSIWDPVSGKRLWDSGSFIEDYAAEHDSASFNQNHGNNKRWDTRSDNRGPETEAIAAALVHGVPMIFVANERQNGLYSFTFDHSLSPTFEAYYNGFYEGHSNPECILYLPPSATKLKSDLIVTAWEATSSITIHKVKP